MGIFLAIIFRMSAETAYIEKADLKRVVRTSVPVTPTSCEYLRSPLGIDTALLPTLRTIQHPLYTHPKKANLSFKDKKLNPLAQQYFEEKARADTAQAQADLNAQRAGQAEIKAEMAEAEASLLETQNGELTARVEQLQSRLDSAFKNESRLLDRIDELIRGARQEGSVSTDPNWSVLGLDPKTAFVGLTQQQQQVVLDGAYRTRSKIFHPDNGGSKNAMQRVNAAYEALKASIK